ncbi:MAG: hypothetical protein ACMVO3_22465 [Thalassobaculum sp.]
MDDMEIARTPFPIENRQMLETMSDQDVVDAVVNWWRENFEDPAESLPYESAEGGYQWIWGGPFEPMDVLSGEYHDVLPDYLIDRIVNEITRDGLVEWTPHQARLAETPGAIANVDEEITSAREPEELPDGRYLSDEEGNLLTTEDGQAIELEVADEPTWPRGRARQFHEGALPRPGPNFRIRSTFWNEIRSRGKAQVTVRVVSIPRWRQTDEPVDHELLLEFLGWADAEVVDDPVAAGAEYRDLFERQLEEVCSILSEPGDTRAFRDRILADGWITVHRNPHVVVELLQLFVDTKCVIKSAAKLGLAVLIVGGAIVVVDIGIHAAEPIGQALGHLGAHWLHGPARVEETVSCIEAFQEAEWAIAEAEEPHP